MDLDRHDLTVDARERGAADRSEHGESSRDFGRGRAVDRGNLDGERTVPRVYDNYPHLLNARCRDETRGMEKWLVTCLGGLG